MELQAFYFSFDSDCTRGILPVVSLRLSLNLLLKIKRLVVVVGVEPGQYLLCAEKYTFHYRLRWK